MAHRSSAAVDDRGSGFRVLSLGYTLDLWQDPALAPGDPLQALPRCDESLISFTLIAHSRHTDNAKPKRLGKNSRAYATNAYTLVDSWLRMFRLGRRVARRQGIDLVHVREPLFNGSIGYVLSRWLRTPLSVCVYGTNPFGPWGKESWLHRLVSPLARAFLRKADGVQVDGSATARSLASAGICAERIAISPLIPSNLSDFLVSERDPELRDNLCEGGRYERLILFVGRIAPEKNLELLLEAASRLAAGHPAVRFILVGDGPCRPALESYSRERGLSQTVHWAGARSHGEVVKYMATCDVFVLCSRWEGFARVLMEAAMGGMPIVTTDVSGSDDAVVDGETGYIVPVGDVAGFARSLSDLVSHPERAAEMGRRARQHMQNFVDRYKDPRLQVRIWQRVLSNRQA